MSKAASASVPSTQTAGQLPLVTMAGRVNVGKSTLFNRLSGRRYALVSRVPGATRDRRTFFISQADTPFLLVDTAGYFLPIDQQEDPELLASVNEQRQQAIEQAHFVWLVCDAGVGLLPAEHDLAKILQRAGKPFGVALNKAESQQRIHQGVEFHRLGAIWVQPFSALHGSGVNDLLQHTSIQLKSMGFAQPPATTMAATQTEIADSPFVAQERAQARVGTRPSKSSNQKVLAAKPLRFALLGKPNVGKSSLANAMLGEQRLIVSNKPGSTREAIETPFTHQDQAYILMDSAGLRRKARVTSDLETLGALHTLEALWQMDVVVLVMDATQPVSDQDCRIASYIEKRRKAVVVVLNKCDLLHGGLRQLKEVEKEARHALGFIEYASFLCVSATQGRGLGVLLREVKKAALHYRKWFATADVNRVVEWIVQRTPPPAKGPSPTTIRYGVQTHSAPPTLQLFTNRPKLITGSYHRFFQKQLRYHLQLHATPIVLHWKQTPRSPARLTAPYKRYVKPTPKFTAKPSTPQKRKKRVR